MSVWRWADHFESIPESFRLTLGEGETPLLHSRSIGPDAGLPNLYFKLETTNPSGSYKDRFAATAVSDMLARGKKRCVATSSGNTGAALAAYCAAAGIRCQIAVVETAPEDKLRQMLAYGAEIYRVKDFGLDPKITARTFESLREIAEAPEAALQISAFKYCPTGMSGVRSISLELNEQLEQIDHVFCPAGGGGLTLALAQGFAAVREPGFAAFTPAIECAQPEGNDTIAGPLRNGLDKGVDVDCSSKISGLQVPNVIDGNEVIEACRASGGNGHTVSDESVWESQARLAVEEGIFSEPAGAVAIAAALQAASQALIDPNANIVCLVTGSGFKDANSVERMVGKSASPVIDSSELADAMSAAPRKES
jgi:threonine synthase